MKRLVFLVLTVFFLTGCQVKQSIEVEPATKQGDTTLSGKIVKSGETFALVGSDGKQTDIDSYKIELSDYADKTVTITGQYSGDTLFVAKVTE